MSLEQIVKLHPTVLLQITDSYERRYLQVPRVIGTLLGTDDKGVIEITNCYCLPYKNYIDQEHKIDPTFMYDLNQCSQGCQNEKIVGWWITGGEINKRTCEIHQIYQLISDNNPIHMTVDLSFQNSKRIELKAYTRVLKCRTGNMFAPVRIQIQYSDPEITGFKLCKETLALKHHKNSKNVVEPVTDLVKISDATDELSELLDNVLRYVDDVLDGVKVADNKVGRILLDMVNSVPQMTCEEFIEMFNSSAKDLLMVIALSQLMKVQLMLNEKLNWL